MKVEREVGALEWKWNVDTDRCSAEKDGNDESVKWLNDTLEKNKDSDEQCWKQTLEISVRIWSPYEGIRFITENTI